MLTGSLFCPMWPSQVDREEGEVRTGDKDLEVTDMHMIFQVMGPCKYLRESIQPTSHGQRMIHIRRHVTDASHPEW